MQLTWTYLLAQYGKKRGGAFFGGNDDSFDGQLVLTRREKSPLLVMLRQVRSGRYASNQLTARTSVRLSGDYTLDIRPKGLAGSGCQAIMGLAGHSWDYGCPEATQGRIIASNDQNLTRQLLGSLELRQALALARQTGERLRVCPDVRGDGWHLVEVDWNDLDTGLKKGPWPRDAILDDSPYRTDRAVLFQTAQKQFDNAMDGFLGLLTAAGDFLASYGGIVGGR